MRCKWCNVSLVGREVFQGCCVGSVCWKAWITRYIEFLESALLNVARQDVNQETGKLMTKKEIEDRGAGFIIQTLAKDACEALGLAKKNKNVTSFP